MTWYVYSRLVPPHQPDVLQYVIEVEDDQAVVRTPAGEYCDRFKYLNSHGYYSDAADAWLRPGDPRFEEQLFEEFRGTYTYAVRAPDEDAGVPPAEAD